jgi:5-(carboxyamino)imidazole ribonucleotide synthase
MKVGIVGGGQLGRMLAMAGLPLGMRFRFLEPSADCPAAALGEVITAPYDDPDGLERFASQISIATFEFENVPASTAESLAQRLALAPGPRALAVSQDRISEKRFFRECGVPVQAFAAVSNAKELDDALASVGTPAMLKTRRLGYDGKGQRLVREAAQAATAWQELGKVPCILESLVPFSAEVSLVATRTRRGGSVEWVSWPLAQNAHAHGILRRSVAPAPCDPSGALAQSARTHVRRIMDELDYIGTMAVEFFVTHDGLIANEMAPRVHNSGHWTIDGAHTSQFENHMRAVASMALGPTAARGLCAMVNLVGRAPSAAELLAACPEAHVHLYGKHARAGRKLGHVTVVTEDQATLDAALARLEPLCTWAV